MYVIFEGDGYQFWYDWPMGVGMFRRNTDNKTTLLETGTDCQDLIDSLTKLEADVSESKFKDLFDNIAEEYNYD